MRRHCRNVILGSGYLVALLAVNPAERAVESQAQAQPTTRQQATTVCELLKNPPAYRDQVVTVRGIYWYGLRERCREQLVTGDHTWPSAIDMVDADSPVSDGVAAHFKTDSMSWERLDQAVRKVAASGKKREIWITVTGMIRAPVSYRRRDGEIVGGYGHLGVFPAQLVVKEIGDVAVKDIQTYDYRELLHGQ